MEEYRFFKEFTSQFLSEEYNQFIFSGNIYDIFKHQDNYHNLVDFLTQKLSPKRQIIKFNIAEGVNFPDNEQKLHFVDNLSKNLRFFSQLEEKRNWVVKNLAHSRASAVEGFNLLKEAVRSRYNKPYAFIIEHAETIIPDTEVARMGDADRQKLVFLRDWLGDENFIKSHHIIIFISQTISEIHKSICNLPSLSRVVIDYPDYEMRKSFIEEQSPKNELKMDISVDNASDLTAGLNLNGVKHIIQHASYLKKPLTEELILSKTEEVIKGTIGDYIKVINPDHTFKDVLGAARIKMELQRQVQIIQLGDPSIIPRGYLVCGRNGVGKTYIMEAFAKQLGWLCIELKNMRQKYLGETDIIFERVKTVLESFKNVMVFIDEADTMFGGRGENVHETEKRLTGNFIKMIGDPANRGKIIWIFITSRPDLLLPDFIRRLEVKFGFFNPQGEDRLAFLQNILAKVEIDFGALKKREQKKLLKGFRNFSPAEFKMITTQLIAQKKISSSFTTQDVLLLLKRINLNISREKYQLQDGLARKYSSFIDLMK
ncbi:MAG: ATP-binding protein [Spirochaetes bacterium]|nr:ATP-binding protein [Spirochaetota bacterium]